MICAIEIRASLIENLEVSVIDMMCKLEKIFPPSFFDVMEHLIMHLPYEAKTSMPPHKKCLTNKELKIAETYVLVNCTEMKPYLQQFEDSLRETNPNITNDEILKARDEKFHSWLKELVKQAQQIYCTKYPVSGSRVNGEWSAACKVRAKLFMDETLNSVGEVSNEFSTFDYYQDDDESLTIHDRTSEEEEINLLDAHSLMEEANVDELPNPMDAPHTDSCLILHANGSPLVAIPSASASPTNAKNSRDFACPSPELPGASTDHIPDSIESTVPHVGVDRTKDKYRFQSDNDRKMARDVWEKTCGDQYSDILTKHRVKMLDELKTKDITKLKGHGPSGIRAEVWDGLVDIWSTPEWQKKSEAAKRNRATVPDAMLHTGGSISFSAHKKKMEAEKNQKVSWRDVYHKTHKKKNGEFVFERSKNFAENLGIALLDKYGEESSSYPEVNQAPTPSSQCEERQSNLANDDADLGA
ncbi:putative transposase, Ptta/En/Spm, plant [Senna tora]|uniref:Putative transposase, Ptta/En/Spm, plant n=1 Tax=Senna tora TaxID=362788 RepID=A0A834T056_9FABA|nr:putative transposase, Ptta/En/Spm, plant [Senna tora]